MYENNINQLIIIKTNRILKQGILVVALVFSMGLLINRVIDLNAFSHIMHFGPRGNGPGEVNCAVCLGKLNSKGEFYVFDDMPRKFRFFSIDSKVVAM